ncbi:MAG TPA: prenyltransferase/squalene oxidase repeat-containing protein [Blastocatellia bacterium]|nr:prenyltransferase/squalene oxidase repeat-containing protein [Blastocatellia bacterium]
MKQVRQVIREMNPAYWPFGAAVMARDCMRSVVKLPATPYSYSKVGTPTREALSSVMQWVADAQDANADGGVAAYFSLYGGFGPSYPETTGYLIPTLIDYGSLVEDEGFHERAVRAARWLRTLQFPNGAFPGGFARRSDGPSVFNTGQIVFGLAAAGAHTGCDEYFDSAARAGEWLASVQSDDGAWRQFTYEGRCHVYYTMVAWAMAELFKASGEPTFRDAAERNIDWALALRQSNGWFDGYNLSGRPVYLHFIAYTLQGLLEAAVILESERAIEAVRDASERLMRKFEINKWLPGAYTSQWKPSASYTCLTGNAQMAIVWQRLGEITTDLRFSNAAIKMNELLKSKISYRAPRGIRGGVKGSDPIWGKYLALRYPNWAAKFTADSFMLELRLLDRLRRSTPL